MGPVQYHEMENACFLSMQRETMRGPKDCRPEHFLEDENASKCWHNFLGAELTIVTYKEFRNHTIVPLYTSFFDYRPCQGGKGGWGVLRCAEGLETFPNSCAVALPVTEHTNKFGAKIDFYAFAQDVGATWGQPVIRANVFPFHNKSLAGRIEGAVCSVNYKLYPEKADCFGLKALGDKKLKPKAPPTAHWFAGTDYPNMDVHGNPAWPITTSPEPTVPDSDFTPLGIVAGLLLLLLALAACYDWRKGRARALESEVEMQ